MVEFSDGMYMMREEIMRSDLEAKYRRQYNEAYRWQTGREKERYIEMG